MRISKNGKYYPWQDELSKLSKKVIKDQEKLRKKRFLKILKERPLKSLIYKVSKMKNKKKVKKTNKRKIFDYNKEIKTIKDLANLVVEYNIAKRDEPDPKCVTCKGTGIETYYCHHNGNEEETECNCKRKSIDIMYNKLERELKPYSSKLLKLCKDFLKK